MVTFIAFEIGYFQISNHQEQEDELKVLYVVESIVECTLFAVASITMIVLWRKFRELVVFYMSEQDLAAS